jgi:hypothetical protein
MDVWKEIHSEAWRQIRESGFLEWKRLSGSVGIPIVSGFIQWKAGVTLPINLAVNLGGGLALYTILVFVERYVRIRAIVEDREATWRNSVNDREKTIADLKSLSGQFRSVINSLQITGYSATLSTLSVSVELEIRSLAAPPTTMHDFTLCLLDGRNLVARELGTRMKLDTGELGKRRCNFELSGISAEDAVRLRSASDWKATFKDVHDNPYETPVFRYAG